MFQGPTFDVAIGVVVLFLVTSLLASAMVETAAGFLHRRSKNLWDTIDLMLGKSKIGDGSDAENLVDRIYRQTFITKLVQPKAQNLYPRVADGGQSTRGLRSYKSDLNRNERKRRFHGPQQIAPPAFAKAFIEAVRPGGNVDADVDSLKARIKTLPEAISKPLGAVLNEANIDFATARTRIEDWYETHMQSVTIWYRKQTRYFLFIAGLVIAVVGNIDAIGATKTLYRDQSVRESVVAEAVAIGKSDCDKKDTANAKVACLRNDLGGAVTLPIGWSDVDRAPGAWTLRILGWLLVAGAVTLGAPFWFDLLRKALAHRKTDSG
jgi:hypothetical protein